MNTEIAGLKSNTSSNAQKLSDLSDSISSIGTDLGTVEGKVSQLEQADFGAQIQGISAKQTDQENQLKDVVDRLDKVEVSGVRKTLFNFKQC